MGSAWDNYDGGPNYYEPPKPLDQSRKTTTKRRSFVELYEDYKRYYIDNISWMETDPWIKGKTPEETFKKHVNKMKTHEFMETLAGFGGYSE